MTAEDARAQHCAFISEVGEEILIHRTGSSDVAVRARVMGYQPKELIGTIAQGDVKIIALVDTLADLLPLNKSTDAVVVRGKEMAIKAVDDNTRRIGGVLIALEIQAGD